MARDRLTGSVNYLGPMTEAPVGCTHDRELGNFNLIPHEVALHDLREAPGSLDREGFLLARADVAPRQPGEAWEALAERHRLAVVEVPRKLTDAEKLIVSPPTMRYSAPPDKAAASAAHYIHTDFTEVSFPRLMAKVLGDDPDKERLLAGRSAILQTWAALSPPPHDKPLAILDRSTMQPQDLVKGTVMVGVESARNPHEAYLIRHNPAHRWAHVSDMDLADVLVFLGFDSRTPELPGSPHTSSYVKAEGGNSRVSYETRAFVFWG